MDDNLLQHQDSVFVPAQPQTLNSINGPRLTTSHKRMLGYLGASLCFFSELIHLWLLPGQYEIYLVYGLIFLLIAMAQGFIAANLLFGPRRHLLTFALGINLLIVVLYGFTHTIGVLVGLAFLPLSIDPWGIIATLAEVVAIIVILFLRCEIPHGRKNKIKKVNNVKEIK